jgi:predicted nucleotidyltransferase
MSYTEGNKDLKGGEHMTTDAALQQLVPGLRDIYGNLLDSIILFGSVARGTQTDESDVDIALILFPGATSEMYDRMLDLVIDLELACGKVLSVIRIDRERFKEWEATLPFYQNIRKEGVVLWQAA